MLSIIHFLPSTPLILHYFQWLVSPPEKTYDHDLLQLFLQVMSLFSVLHQSGTLDDFSL